MSATSTHVLGISCFYHDSAAALLKDGVVIAAGQEERFSRKRHDSGFPHLAIQYVLHQAGIKAEDLDAVGSYDKPLLKFERMLSTYVATFPRSFASFRKAIPIWLHEKLWVPSIIRKELKPYSGPILFAEHHMSHAASCFLPSPFEEAAILTVDGVGEWATASFGVGRGTDITMFKEIRFPHSLGLLYSAFTYYLGFKVNSAEYKVMGLAPYGKPVHFERIMKQMVHLNQDGSFKLNMKYFSYDYGLRMTNGAFDDFFGGPPRKPETWMTEREFDIAASVQKVCEEVVLRMVRHLHQETGLDRLCMAGGVALNCVANGRVIRETPMKQLWVQPAAGDAGGAVGVAHYIYNTIHKRPRAAAWTHAYLGPEFSDAEIARFLDEAGAKYETLTDAELVKRTAKLISENHVIGWFQGRREFGPRRQLGAAANGHTRRGAALLRPDPGVRAPHRRPDRDQHLVQRARRADRLHSPGRLLVLHAHEHGQARARPSRARQAAAAAAARGRGLALALRAGLSGWMTAFVAVTSLL